MGSKAAVGDYDTITIVGYGTWSRDQANGRHVVTLQEMSAPDHPFYLSVQIDGGLLSNTHLKPPQILPNVTPPVFNAAAEADTVPLDPVTGAVR